ncbi:hypothetical protein AAHA92_05421 [Salvia divinorum]|uniref:Uncharacterized protein n=1 Tax=Salvia divinorum TaxID=28513 RepID=A0ABD1I5W2_SALDI
MLKENPGDQQGNVPSAYRSVGIPDSGKTPPLHTNEENSENQQGNVPSADRNVGRTGKGKALVVPTNEECCGLPR